MQSKRSEVLFSISPLEFQRLVVSCFEAKRSTDGCSKFKSPETSHDMADIPLLKSDVNPQYNDPTNCASILLPAEFLRKESLTRSSTVI